MLKLSVFLFSIFSSVAVAKPIPVVVSVAYLKDLIDEVTCGSKNYEVDVLIPSAVDPHTYVLTPNDRRDIEKSTLFFSIGSGFESWLISLQKSKTQVQWVQVTEKLKLRRIGKGAHQHGSHSHAVALDTHIWHSPELTINAAKTIAETLYKNDASETSTIKKCLSQFENKVRDSVGKLKTLKRTMVGHATPTIAMGHDALHYFADAMEFKVVSLLGLSTSEQLTPQVLKNAIADVKKANVKVMFFEATNPARDGQNIAKQLNLKFGGQIYADGLGPVGSGAETTLGLWNKNLQTIVSGLK